MLFASRLRLGHLPHHIIEVEAGGFLARRELIPFGTVSLTTYFHTSSDELAAEDITRVLAVADARIFHRSYGDQNGELWSPSGRMLATTTQIAYFKA